MWTRLEMQLGALRTQVCVTQLGANGLGGLPRAEGSAGSALGGGTGKYLWNPTTLSHLPLLDQRGMTREWGPLGQRLGPRVGSSWVEHLCGWRVSDRLYVYLCQTGCMCVCVCLCVCISVSLCVYVWVYMSLSVYVYLYDSVCVSACMCPWWSGTH